MNWEWFDKPSDDGELRGLFMECLLKETSLEPQLKTRRNPYGEWAQGSDKST